jgi:hypothetical protein
MSKPTLDDWYGKDWRNNNFQNDYYPTFKEINQEEMQVEEPEYFKQFGKVLNSAPKILEDPLNYSEIRNVNEQVGAIQNSATGKFKDKYRDFIHENKESGDCSMYMIKENSPLVGTIGSQNFSPIMSKNDEHKEELFSEPNYF